ncbi:alkylhydroperoxidase AhpD family core domain-containing protein [Sphingopyxis sp. YR583]|uniref:carboxymuconolactone decarboxylase family protein n=1 Tax=Sphingopyxis sp. YR583 TaxID=1881047 RepID=UPI0008A78DAC|nr:carboxymuconolactone decarboxylase family protein [Sphingopyxis sp. YR583]SEH10752.1 alkylhydroperoxidase AhpD family core domain-containing protein [Sphingopyxis sp. YR583]
MTPRMNIFQAAPDAMKAMLAVEATFETSGIEHSLLELVKLRASQINGCAFCIHMHVTDAVKHSETNMRIHLLDAWRESPLYTDRERAALNWTESLTGIAETGAPDADYELLKAHFDDKQIAYLTVAIAAINFWNTVQISLRAVHPVEQAAAA